MVCTGEQDWPTKVEKTEGNFVYSITAHMKARDGILLKSLFYISFLCVLCIIFCFSAVCFLLLLEGYCDKLDIEGTPKVFACSEPSSGEGYDMYLASKIGKKKAIFYFLTQTKDMCIQMR